MSNKPSFEAIIATYHQEVARGGTLGALGRAAKRLDVSHETVRRAKIRDEQCQPDDELLYIPPPDGYPQPVPNPALCRAKLRRPRPMSPLLGHNVRVRRADRDSTFHFVNEPIENVGVVVSVPAVAVMPMVRHYPVRQRRIESVKHINWKQVLAYAVVACLIVAASLSTTHAAQPIRATFAPAGMLQR